MLSTRLEFCIKNIITLFFIPLFEKTVGFFLFLCVVIIDKIS
nr:MAG TPA: hypothetical protein [Caudoviricetes sp.]